MRRSWTADRLPKHPCGRRVRDTFQGWRRNSSPRPRERRQGRRPSTAPTEPTSLTFPELPLPNGLEMSRPPTRARLVSLYVSLAAKQVSIFRSTADRLYRVVGRGGGLVVCTPSATRRLWLRGLAASATLRPVKRTSTRASSPRIGIRDLHGTRGGLRRAERVVRRARRLRDEPASQG